VRIFCERKKTALTGSAPKLHIMQSHACGLSVRLAVWSTCVLGVLWSLSEVCFSCGWGIAARA
jgi:hypothetical protein